MYAILLTFSDYNAVEVTKVSFYPFDGPFFAANIVHDLTVCESALLEHASNAFAPLRPKIWCHWWLVYFVAECASCSLNVKRSSVGWIISNILSSLCAVARATNNDYRCQIHLRAEKTA
jgi:hypothetical protein